MKKLFVILIFLFLGIFVNQINAADFMDSFIEYRYQIKRNLGVDTANTAYVSDTALNQFIRYSIVKTNAILKTYQSADIFTTNYKTPNYSLLSDSLVGIIDVRWQREDSIKPLIYLPQNKWGELKQKHLIGGDGYTKRPSYYDYINDTLFLYPVPIIIGDTIVVKGWKKIGDISGTTDLTDIKQAYRVVVLDHATYRVALAKQHPLVEHFLREYQDSKNEIMVALNGRYIVAPPTGQ